MAPLALAVAASAVTRAARPKQPEVETLRIGSGYGEGPTYWNKRYSQACDTWEWLGRWQDISGPFTRYVDKGSGCRILHPGCGSSVLAEEMQAAGYCQITSIDTSDVVIEWMNCRNRERQLDGLRSLCMDVTKMEFSNGRFDVVIEKALLDSLHCCERKQLQVGMYLKEVVRVLRPGGLFFCISLSRDRAGQLGAAPWNFNVLESVPFGCSNMMYICQRTNASGMCLASWPSLFDALCRGLTAHDFDAVDMEGSWTDAASVKAGDVVEVVIAFLTGDSPRDQVLLPKGLRGIVRLVDSDGDAVIRFPRLAASPERVDRFVMEAQLQNLRVRHGLDSDPAVGDSAVI